MTSFEVLGTRVDAVGKSEAVERIAALAAGTTPSLVVTLGVEMVMAARGNATFRAAINDAALVTCDTVGLLLASRLRGGPLRERVTGVELVPALAERSATCGDVRLFLLGSAGETAQRAGAELQRGYPGATIAGTHHGYFGADDDAVVAAIRASGANVLLAGLGSPRQELWLAQHLAATGATVGIGVGGSFDVIAGTVRRAPSIVQRSGFEWLYRLVRQPSRWRRQLALPAFAVAVVLEALVAASRGKKEER